ncbi:DUF411 domain-containing protein [Nitrincola sp. MINF-07-Sa-05]|uniref:DUF411 domain-containing protein n=1 Tax=Nitrincola salilacus TaxID=3400273 RepID=UPI003917C2B6
MARKQNWDFHRCWHPVYRKDQTALLIEGHVPAGDILRLLKEKPAIKGLSVPGMPHGSPGMETGRQDHYKVFAFDQEGQQPVVWSEYNPQ